MAQVTIYLDDGTADRVKRAARESGVSVSAWMAQLVRERIDDAWPAEVLALRGAWPDFPLAEEIRAGEVSDLPRESL
jgi:hypothetical protein